MRRKDLILRKDHMYLAKTPQGKALERVQDIGKL